MQKRRPRGSVKLGFEELSLRIPIDSIVPRREIASAVRDSVKYTQIAASIAEVGIVEPPVVVRDPAEPNRYHLLDGHLRVDVMRARGERNVVCLVATDDEAFTYNRRVSRLTIIQEHKMILNAVKKGVSEERLARALNVNIASIRAKRNLLVGICPEAADLLREKVVPIQVFSELRFLKPLRQIEAAQAMATMNRFSVAYMRSLVAATPVDQLADQQRPRHRGLTPAQIGLMQRESENLDREFRLVEKDYRADHLDLTLAIGYVARLLDNVRVVRHLANHHAGILAEFQKIAELNAATQDADLAANR